MKLPETVLNFLEIFNKHGFSAYVAGGAVRDGVCGVEPSDYDVATSARVEDTRSLFPAKDVFETGVKHGTLSVRFEGRIYEVTTFRIDGEYSDNRRPDSVSFTDDVVADLARRDFTVNAMAVGRDGVIVDPFGGVKDVENKIIRAVGDPEKRFTEDALRILRAVRFAATTGFRIEEKTYSAMLNKSSLLATISKERVYQEMTKLLLSENAYVALNDYKEIIFEVIPELKLSDGFDQKNPAHFADVYGHTLYALKILKTRTPVTVWATLLHDIGKPLTMVVDPRGCGHFPTHMSVSADMAETILSDLKTSNDLKRRVCAIIRVHDEPFHGKYAVKKFLNKYDEDLMEDLITVKFADIYAHSQIGIDKYLEQRLTLKSNFDEIKKNGECYRLSDLDLKGDDLLSLGFQPEGIGKILDDALDAVMSDNVANDKKRLLDFVTEKYGND